MKLIGSAVNEKGVFSVDWIDSTCFLRSNKSLLMSSIFSCSLFNKFSSYAGEWVPEELQREADVSSLTHSENSSLCLVLSSNSSVSTLTSD